MIHALFSFCAKLGLFAISVLLGMAGYLYVKAKGTDTALETSMADVALATTYREVPFDAKPALLARVVKPVDVGGDAFGTLYILQKDGKVIRTNPENGAMAVSTQFAALATGATDSTLGFSAIAIHPEFLVKDRPGFGKFYVVVAEKAGTAPVDFRPEFGTKGENHQDVLYEFTSEHPMAGNFRGKRRELMRFSQPGPRNNVDSLAFDHHGFLYIGVGDGDAADVARKSPSKNASSLKNAYGKVLRINPTGNNSKNEKYGIPESNPFQIVTEALPELWAFGLRAPHSLYFDPYNTSLCIGERAYGGIEKVNLSHMGGEHFGWDITEGGALSSMAARAQLEEIVQPPVFALSRKSGMIGTNTGNLVYRGENFPSLAGKLIFASHDGRILVSSPNRAADGERNTITTQALNLGEFSRKKFSALRSSPRGELIVLCEDGSVYEMQKQDSIGSERKRQRALFCQL
ncbi:MAG: PQQ-dependent sugar dehydrogenase [Verrucomicrobiales bacterium]|nr:PQQ-dependent sugar dehydrogenase [Verrucomicrobiales bacterium]